MTDPEAQTHWKCSECGVILQAERPPEVCPACQGLCEFKDVTCYLPECGGPGNLDPRL